MSLGKWCRHKCALLPLTLTYSHHVVTFHIWFIFILTFVVKLAEEIEGNDSVKVNHHSQQTHCHHELSREGKETVSTFKPNPISSIELCSALACFPLCVTEDKIVRRVLTPMAISSK